MSIFNDVAQFMNACGQTVPNTNVQETDISRLYKKLIEEEYKEWVEADGFSDDTERLDAIFDVMWVMIGYAHSRGWDMEAAWKEGAWSNLAKIDSETGKVIKNEAGKVQKPEGWKPPNFRQFVE